MFETIKKAALQWAENDWQNQVELTGENVMKVYTHDGECETIKKDEYFSSLNQASTFFDLERWYVRIIGVEFFGFWLDTLCMTMK